jgi:hypothetical protein
MKRSAAPPTFNYRRDILRQRLIVLNSRVSQERAAGRNKEQYAECGANPGQAVVARP